MNTNTHRCIPDPIQRGGLTSWTNWETSLTSTIASIATGQSGVLHLNLCDQMWCWHEHKHKHERAGQETWRVTLLIRGLGQFGQVLQCLHVLRLCALGVCGSLHLCMKSGCRCESSQKNGTDFKNNLPVLTNRLRTTHGPAQQVPLSDHSLLGPWGQATHKSVQLSDWIIDRVWCSKLYLCNIW